MLVGSSGCSRISDDEGLAHSELFHTLCLASSATGCVPTLLATYFKQCIVVRKMYLAS